MDQQPHLKTRSTPMSETPISPLRRRMIEDMSLRNFGEKTQHDYIGYVKTFSTFLGRSPAIATPEDLRRYQVQQSQSGVSPLAKVASPSNAPVSPVITMARFGVSIRYER